MAKRKASGPGLLKQLRRGFKRAARAFDQSADFMARRSRGKVIRTASKERAGDGTRLPTKPIKARWAHQKEGDKQEWYANFEGVSFVFVIWPEDDLRKVEAIARKEAIRLYGSYAETWVLHELRLIGTLADQENQDAHA